MQIKIMTTAKEADGPATFSVSDADSSENAGQL
jgi:hypothetical protein